MRRLARLVSSFLMPLFLNATVTSSSSPRTWLLMTVPSPNRPWLTRSPILNWGAPAGRAAGAARGAEVGDTGAAREGDQTVLLAGRVLRDNILAVAEAILKRDRTGLRQRRGVVIDEASGQALLDLAELGRIAYFRSDTLPAS